MRILIVLREFRFFALLDTVAPKMLQDGHSVHLLADEVRSRGETAWALDTWMANTPNFSTGVAATRKDGWRRTAFGFREIRSYASYLNRQDQSEFYMKRWEGYLNRHLKWAVQHWNWVRSLVGSPFTESLLRSFEQLIPPDREITTWLRHHQPDVLVTSPMNMRFDEEVEYVKAARKLRIPTVVPVYSWDNLTTKGLYQIIPDVVLAWNQAQCEEAVQIHHVPPERIVVTGAQRFDEWFEPQRYHLSRQDFCDRSGLDPQRPYILYLGSSANIAKDETWLVKELADALKTSGIPELARIQVLARSHPANTINYDGIQADNLIVWPRGNRATDTDEVMQGFYNSLQYCMATVGLNTTGMIDAMINDRPGVTIMTDRYRRTQLEAVHFRQLLKADALEVAADIPECIALLRSISDGVDRKKQQRNQFVREYIRPRGLHNPAGDLVARAIEWAGEGHNAAQINALLDQAGYPISI